MNLNSLKLTDSLYGLRAIAALTVVFSHASKKGFFLLPGLDLSGTGKIAVWLFFLLSAFTLTWQYLESLRANVPHRIISFLTRRIFRIFPLFWTAVLLDWVLGRIQWEHVWNSLLLISAPNHFWAVPVEFQYYLLIPLIASGLALQNSWYRIIFILGLATLGILSLWTKVPIALGPFLPCFIIGSLLAFYLSSYGSLLNELSLYRLNIMGFGLAVGATPSVMHALGWADVIGTDALRNNSTLFGLAFAPVIAAAIALPNFRAYLSAPWLRIVGKMSFSIYLLHPLAIDLIDLMAVNPIAGGWSVLTLTLFFSALGYALIEKPIRSIGYRLTCNLQALTADGRRDPVNP